MHYGQFDTDARAKKTSDHPHAMRVATIDLDRGDTAWNPGSTKSDITGPARVIYSQHVDGSYNYTVVRPKLAGEPPAKQITLGESDAHFLKAAHGSNFDPDGYELQHYFEAEDGIVTSGHVVFAHAEALAFAKFVMAHEEAGQ